MAKFTSISVCADVAKDKVRYIKDVLLSEYPTAKIDVKSSSDFKMRCNIESEGDGPYFYVSAPLMERNLMNRVNRIVNYYNTVQ